MIIRLHSDERKRYVIIDNRAAEDTRLSLRAKGLLLYLLSRPDNWKASPSHLQQTTCDSPHVIRGALKELEKTGYATLRVMGGGGRGKIRGSEWVISELPFEVTRFRDSELLKLEKVEANKDLGLTNNDKKQRKDYSLPPELSALEAPWTEWLQHKREIRHAMTPMTYKKQIKMLSEIGVERGKAAIEHSIASGYIALCEPKGERAGLPENLTRLKTWELKKRREKIIDRKNDIYREYGKNPQGAVGKEKLKLWKEQQAIDVELQQRQKGRAA